MPTSGKPDCKREAGAVFLRTVPERSRLKKSSSAFINLIDQLTLIAEQGQQMKRDEHPDFRTTTHDRVRS